MSKPFVSIITPTYNHEKFIGKAIESVLRQTYSNWEMIIIDDGSTDRTVEVIQQYKDPRILCIQNKHRGIYRLAETYNQALSQTSGELVAILEGDDFWPKYKLGKQIQAFDLQDIVLVWGKGVVSDENGKFLYVRSSVKTSNEFEDLLPSTILQMMRRDNPITPASTIMVRKVSVMAIGGFQPSPSGIYVDLPTWMKLASSCQGIFRFVNLELGYWRTHPNQVTSTTRVQQLIDHAKLINQYGIEGYDSYSRYIQARAALVAREWRDSRRLFASLIPDNTIEKKDKIICLLGFISTFIRVDLVKVVLYLKNRIRVPAGYDEISR